jgi:raffinose/stachyose/melibiose transport system permease protein
MSGRRRLLIYLGPLFLLQFVVIFIPAIMNVGYAFTEWKGFDTPRFVGFDNFVRLYNDEIFWTALMNNVRWTIFFLTVPIGMALLGAFFVTRIPRGQMVFRVMFFVPYIIAPVVNAEMWRYIFNPLTGIGPILEKYLGWSWANIGYFAHPDTVLYAIANVDNWHWWGFLFVLYLTAMQAVPRDLYDAAKVDGAGPWKQFKDVTLPGIMPTVFYTLLITLSGSFLIFDYVWILTEGGPGRTSEVLGSYMYKQAFYGFEMGYSAAIALGMTLIAAAFSVVFVLVRRFGGEV